MERVHRLTSMSRYYVVLPGSLGSLQETVCIWTISMLQRDGLPRPVILVFRDPWERCLRDVAAALRVADSTMQLLRFVDSAEEAMQIILEDEKKMQSSL
ncbi:putative ribosomal protein L32-like protein [Trypanosoma grayi]|uniref:putative ribosomal protein L32-like protein n=1 Tax=Trypanosoma grayi TaxID=71804 RepID=UPI0004F4065C|nr:putative ribosomal protein L32-like protein [Trypanosoma grayi]KEG07914.1 putative ribosomal protein L32-like protein [Trypanosoma grayi]